MQAAPQSSTDRSSTQPTSSRGLPDALRKALGQVILDQRREWQRDRELIAATATTAVAEATRDFAELRATLREMVAGRLAGLKDGQNGRDGIDGKDGPEGRVGPPGVPGERGEQGVPGAQGEHGLDGKDGLNGEEGRVGPPGERGEAGPQGPAGERGLEGRGGLDGKDGRDGTDGPQGPAGERGPPGERGIDGKNADELEAPDDLAQTIAQAVRMLAETPALRQAPEPRLAPINIVMPEQKMPEIKIPDPVINVHMPEQPAAVVNYVPPETKATRTRVTKHDSKGRIVEFVREEL